MKNIQNHMILLSKFNDNKIKYSYDGALTWKAIAFLDGNGFYNYSSSHILRHIKILVI